MRAINTKKKNCKIVQESLKTVSYLGLLNRTLSRHLSKIVTQSFFETYHDGSTETELISDPGEVTVYYLKTKEDHISSAVIRVKRHSLQT